MANLGHARRSNLDDLNNQQRLVVEESGRHCCVVAIPGSGKTKTCTSKIGQLLDQDLVDEDGTSRLKCVMAVTFTVQAANELKHRAGSLVHPSALDRLTTGTFHSIFLRRLRSIGAEIAHRRVATTGQANQYRDRALQECVPEWKSLRSESLREALRASFEEVRSRFAEPQANADAQIVKAVRHYRAELKQRRLLDFTLILEAAFTYLQADAWPGIGRVRGTAEPEGDDPASAFVREKRRFIGADHVIVDEYQDVDQLQCQITLAMARLGCVVDIVGDDDQSIFGFRQSLGFKGMEQFTAACGARTMRLEHNYRCKDEILALARQVIERNDETRRVPKRLVGTRGAGGVVTLDEFPSGDAETADLARQIAGSTRADKESAKNRTRAVLGRVNKVLDEVEGVLRERQIPFDRLGSNDIWGEDPICFFVAALAAFTGKAKWDAMDQCLYWAGVNLAHVDLDEGTALAKATAGERRLVDSLRATYEFGRKHAWSLRPAEVEQCIVSLYRWFHQAAHESGKSKAQVDFYIGRLQIVVKVLAGSAGAASARRATRQDDDGQPQATEHARVGLQGTLSRRLIAATQSNKTGQGDDTAVKLATMHGAKGLEWDQVWVVACDDATIPGDLQDSEDAALALEEERRLMYVAITRARDDLFLSWSPMPAHRESKKIASESRLLMELAKRPRSRRAASRPTGFELKV